jgi:Flp pilus assembly pilin Flp
VRPVAGIVANDRGQGLAEYALILGLIATVCLVVVIVVGSHLTALLTRIASAL